MKRASHVGYNACVMRESSARFLSIDYKFKRKWSMDQVLTYIIQLNSIGYKTCHRRKYFQSLTSVTLKSRSNQNPG
jgi:hypothetical protein